MILQYFKKKENEYKKIANILYISVVVKSKDLLKINFFKEVNFDTSFELISIILIFYMKILKDKKNDNCLKISDKLIKNFIDDLDKSLREAGIGDMSIGKHVKKYVKKFYYRIKIIDPILEDFNKINLMNYLNSLKFIDEKNTLKMADALIIIYQNIIKNKEIQ